MTTRPSDALLAAAATIAAVLPLNTLTENGSWIAPAVWSCLAVALVGVVMRRLTSSRSLVVLPQLLVTAWLLVAIFAGDRLWFGLPGPDAWGGVGELVRDCVNVMQRYAAPVPATPGVQFAIVGAVALLALVVDYLAVSRQSPAAAGMPLLAAFLTAAANSGSSLAPGYFVVAAVMWLILVSRQAGWAVRRWSTTVAAPRTPTADQDVEAEAIGGFGHVARQLGVGAVMTAVLLPALIPHLPTRYVLDGLGRNDHSVGRGGRVGFNSTLDLSRSLQSGSQNVVLTYRTSASTAQPLRVVVASDYVAGEWRPTPRSTETQDLRQVRLISPAVKVSDKQFSAETNALDPPHVAAPQPVVQTDFGGDAWAADPSTDDLYTQARPDSYSLTYREVDVTGAQLRAGIAGGATGQRDPEVQASLAADPGSLAEIDALTRQVTASATTSYDAAVAIQNWLRGGGGFTYSLQLPDSATDANGAQITDPILKFLATKQGYCVQFASAMVMMARAHGIPARMAIGFLPGALDNGLYTVRSSDAHSWPELYFPGAGWLRFEPTPAARTGGAPAYTAPPSNTPVGGTRGENLGTETSGATATSTARDPGAPELGGPAATTTTSFGQQVGAWFQDGRHLVLLAVILGLLGTLVLPLTARLVGRRRRARAATQAQLAEAQWDELVWRLTDLGVPRPSGGGTLREWRKHYVREAYLDEDADIAMGHVVSTLERSRYARPDAERVELADDIKVVTRCAASSRPVLRRVRAFFLPQQAVGWWTRLLTRVTDAPGRWVDAAVDRLPRRH